MIAVLVANHGSLVFAEADMHGNGFGLLPGVETGLESANC